MALEPLYVFMKNVRGVPLARSLMLQGAPHSIQLSTVVAENFSRLLI